MVVSAASAAAPLSAATIDALFPLSPPARYVFHFSEKAGGGGSGGGGGAGVARRTEYDDGGGDDNDEDASTTTTATATATATNTNTNAAAAAEPEQYTIMTPGGVRMQCSMPPKPTSTPRAEQREDYRLRRAVAALTSAKRHGHGSGGGATNAGRNAAGGGGGGGLTSVVRHTGYWSYEVVFGSQVRQFVSAEAAVVAAAQQGQPDAAVTVTVGHAAPPPPRREHVLGRHVAGGDALHLLPNGAVALRQVYDGGEGGRGAVVLVYCNPDAVVTGVAAALVAVDEEPALNYTLTVATADAALCATLPAPRALLRPSNGTCVRLTEGWWTYELCLGGALRQYHETGGSVVQENVLGVYDWRAGERLDAGGDSTDVPALLQNYTHGSGCDLLGNEPRRVTVRFKCGLPRGDDTLPAVALIAVQEPSTCVYTAVVASRAACSHPHVGAAKAEWRPLAVAPIHCRPLTPSPRPPSAAAAVTAAVGGGSSDPPAEPPPPSLPTSAAAAAAVAADGAVDLEEAAPEVEAPAAAEVAAIENVAAASDAAGDGDDEEVAAEPGDA